MLAKPNSSSFKLLSRNLISIPSLKRDEVLESIFYHQHRPLPFIKNTNTTTTTTNNNNNWYMDEYAKLFNTFIPFNPTNNHKSLDISIQDDINVIKLLDNLQISNQKKYCINIMKRKRIKMNKHKWKKLRRAVKNSTRYNKEKIKKDGETRRKQE